jgi:endonuclease-8
LPEGDTVYLAAKRMTAALANKRLTGAELRHPRLVQHDLSGLTVLGVHSVGKHLFTRFDNGRSLHTHFRMDGSWHLYRPGQRWRRPGHQARAVLTTLAQVAVGFCLHDMVLLATYHAVCVRARGSTRPQPFQGGRKSSSASLVGRFVRRSSPEPDRG